MRISNVSTESFLGLGTVNIDLSAPISLITGDNGEGKSSLREAISLCLTETPDRVKFKNTYDRLVTDDADKGIVAIDVDDLQISMALPAGKLHCTGKIPDHPALPYLLKPSAFAALDEKKRSTFISSLSPIKVKSKDMAELAKEMGLSMPKFDSLGMVFRGGFSAVEDHCAEEAKKNKTLWDRTTGTKWGAEKAAEWKAIRPNYVEGSLEEIQGRSVKLAGWLESGLSALATAREQRRAALATQVDREELQAKVKLLPRLEAKLIKDEADFKQWEEKVTDLQTRAGTIKPERVGPELLFALGDAMIGLLNLPEIDGMNCPELTIARTARNRYQATHPNVSAPADAPTPEEIKKAVEARDLMGNAVRNDKRDIAAANAAREILAKAVEDDKSVPPEEEIAKREAEIAELRATIKNVDAQVLSLSNTKAQIESAEATEAEALSLHTHITEWLALKDAFSPAGIPARLLSRVLEPINKVLEDLSDRADWSRVKLVPSESGIEIVAKAGDRDRLRSMHSTAEQYRIDTIIAFAIALLSDLKFVLLDGFDVLSHTGRSDLFALAQDSVEDFGFDQVIIMGTTKEKAVIDDPMFDVHWLQDHKTSVAE